MENQSLNSLYKILFTHLSQKDSKTGIVCYLFASSDEAVYEWLKSEPTIGNGDYNPCISGKLYSSWADEETEEEIEEGEPSFKERVIECKGRMFDDYWEPSDLYYGATEYGWEWVSDVDDDFKQQLIDLDMAFVVK